MSIEHTRKVMEGYWSGHDHEAVAEDAVYTDMASGQQWSGREAVAGMLRFFYEEAFDADFKPERTYFADGLAAVEGRVVGKHIGEFGGVTGTGRDVDVPLWCDWDRQGCGCSFGHLLHGGGSWDHRGPDLVHGLHLSPAGHIDKSPHITAHMCA